MRVMLRDERMVVVVHLFSSWRRVRAVFHPLRVRLRTVRAGVLEFERSRQEGVGPFHQLELDISKSRGQGMTQEGSRPKMKVSHKLKQCPVSRLSSLLALGIAYKITISFEKFDPERREIDEFKAHACITDYLGRKVLSVIQGSESAHRDFTASFGGILESFWNSGIYSIEISHHTLGVSVRLNGTDFYTYDFNALYKEDSLSEPCKPKFDSHLLFSGNPISSFDPSFKTPGFFLTESNNFLQQLMHDCLWLVEHLDEYCEDSNTVLSTDCRLLIERLVAWLEPPMYFICDTFLTLSETGLEHQECYKSANFLKENYNTIKSSLNRANMDRDSKVRFVNALKTDWVGLFSTILSQHKEAIIAENGVKCKISCLAKELASRQYPLHFWSDNLNKLVLKYVEMMLNADHKNPETVKIFGSKYAVWIAQQGLNVQVIDSNQPNTVRKVKLGDKLRMIR